MEKPLNICVCILKKTKKNLHEKNKAVYSDEKKPFSYFNDLDLKSLTDNKRPCKTAKSPNCNRPTSI